MHLWNMVNLFVSFQSGKQAWTSMAMASDWCLVESGY